MVPGGSCVARVAAVGRDSTTIAPGRLVFVQMFVQGRDDNTARFLLGLNEGFSEGSQRLMHGEWRDSTWAEYAKVPLENCIPLDETRLTKDLGYTIDDLAYLQTALVPYGGLRDIGLPPGEIIVISPVTGKSNHAVASDEIELC